jgi:alkylated DNA repair dioxygenase AlkB
MNGGMRMSDAPDSLGEQRALFNDDGDPGIAAAPWPEGLRYAPDLISVADEQALIALAARLPLQDARYKDYTARRRVFAFGTRARGEAGYAAPGASIVELPDPLQRLREQVARWAGIDPLAFVHVLVTEYRPGTPLGWHRDAPPYRDVAGVSLGSAARMRWRPWPTDVIRREDILTLTLASRSVYLMSGPARSRWQHSVSPVPALRYSITLRTIDPPR